MLCPKCGRDVPNTARYCRFCGQRLDDEAALGRPNAPVSGSSSGPLPPPAPKRRKKSQFWVNFLIAASSIAMLFAIVTGALYATGHLDDVVRAITGTSRAQTVQLDRDWDGGKPAQKEPPENEPLLRQPAEAPEEAPAEAPEETPAEATAEAADSAAAGAASPIPAPADDPGPLPEAAEPLTSEEIEAAVLDIRERYNAICEGIAMGAYRLVSPSAGTTYYFSGNELVAVILLRSVDGSDYARSYYYTGGNVFFCYYEGADAFRLYFDGGRLIRLRYTPSASQNDSAVNYDQDASEEYRQWEQLVLSEARSLYLSSLSAANCEYILPDSDSRYLTEDDLTGLNAEQCRLARNEIYARHGRRFLDAGLQRYFDSCSWYSGTIDPADFSDSVFNEYERANSRLIVEYERAHGYAK